MKIMFSSIFKMIKTRNIQISIRDANEIKKREKAGTRQLQTIRKEKRQTNSFVPYKITLRNFATPLASTHLLHVPDLD